MGTQPALLMKHVGLRLASVGGDFDLGLEDVQDSSRPFKARFWGQGMHWLSLHQVDLIQSKYVLADMT